ncbi:hypothetical protein Hjap01_03696 [Haloarcula japonica]
MRRFTTPSPSEFLEEYAEELGVVAVFDAVDADIDRLRDILIADVKMLWLRECLSDESQARHKEQAGGKLHLLHNATERGLDRSTFQMRKRTIVRCSRQDRGCKDGCFCLTARSSSTAALR